MEAPVSVLLDVLGVLVGVVLIWRWRSIGKHLAASSERHWSTLPELFPPKRPEDGVRTRLVLTQLMVLLLGVGFALNEMLDLYEILIRPSQGPL